MSQAKTEKFDAASQIWRKDDTSKNLSGMPTTASISGNAVVSQDVSQGPPSLGLTPSEQSVRCHN
jgi:hypothetical protein